MNIGQSCSGPITRRELLRAGALGFFGLTWPNWLRAAARGAKAKACILVYLDGGMSHIDTLDMKPAAPAEYRGEFQPIATTIPGVQVCEHLPRLAQVLRHCALVRSMGQRGRGIIGDNHHTGAYYYLTGHVPDPSFGQLGLNRKPLPDDWPFIGSVVALKKGGAAAIPLIGLPDRAHSAQYIRAGQFGGQLGSAYDPFLVQGDKDKPQEFTIPALSLPTDMSLSRLGDRQALLRQFDGQRRLLDQHAGVVAFDRHQERAFSLLGSAVSGGAFDLEREPAAIRDRYGDDVNGQSMLLARRLVEAGVPFVSVFWQARGNPEVLCSGWDTHRNNFHCLKTYLLPYLDVGFSALIEDMAQRGLLADTLVVLMSEMGRKTRIGDRRAGGENGRDHWVHCQTILLAGGGVRPSFVLGASDQTASYPTERPVGPEDLAATIYHALGITDLTARARDGQQFNLLDDGEPMHELFGSG
ncbi:MAG: DUF1501 domain-containing protein [Gemmataceae bacterium]